MSPIHYATVAAIVLAFVVAAVVVRMVKAIVQRTLGRMEIVGTEDQTAVQGRARQLLHALTFLSYSIAALASISLALSRFGISEGRWDPRLVAHWFATHGINTLLILAGAFVVVRAANLAIEHM